MFFERKYSSEARWPFLAVAAHVPSCTSHSFSQQYFKMSRLPWYAAALLVMKSQSHSFSSRTHRSSLRSFVPATLQLKSSWFNIRASPFGYRLLSPHGYPFQANSNVDIEDNSGTLNLSSNLIFALLTALRLALRDR